MLPSSFPVLDQCLSKTTEELLHMGVSAKSNQDDDTSHDSADCAAASGEDRDPSRRRRQDTVLCLDGGGIKGLVLTELLLALEESSGEKITEMFDWIVGTSTGGILAIALSQGWNCWITQNCPEKKERKIWVFL